MADTQKPSTPQKREGYLKRLYHRILAEADTRRGPAVLAVVAFVESSFFPIPPDPLLIALGLGNPRRAIPLAILTTVASVAGGILGYVIGVWAFDTVGVAILDFFDAHDTYATVAESFIEIGFLAVLAAALTPIPYKVFTIAAGAAGMPLVIFISASLVGRGARFIGEGILIRIFGDQVKEFIDRWFGWLTLAALFLGILGFVAIKYLA